MPIRLATPTDAASIAAIYNQGIADRSATFETEPRTAEERATWLGDRETRHAVLVAQLDDEVVGWAALGPYSSRPCYSGVAEHSIYIARSARGRGHGSALLGALIEVAEHNGFWKLTSRLFLFNAGSRALHAKHGFREVGINEKHARLDGVWLDTMTVERLIPRNID